MAVAVLCCTAAPAACADSDEERLRVVRSALLFSLTKFVEWPDEGQAPLAVCALGDSEFGAVLRENLSERRIRDRSIDVHSAKSVAELGDCDLVFVGETARGSFGAVREAVSGRAVLTVASYPGFIDAGGVAGFVPSGEKLSLELNLGAARAQGLKLDSRLLRLAGRVIGRRPQEEP